MRIDKASILVYSVFCWLNSSFSYVLVRCAGVKSSTVALALVYHVDKFRNVVQFRTLAVSWNMDTTTQANTTVVSEQQSTVKPNFGNGRYSGLMEEVWHDAQTVFGLSSEQAAKLAQGIARDVGAAMAGASYSVKLSKIDKDGRLTISEAAKLKNVTITNNIMALKALQYAGEAGRNGFSFANTRWQVVKGLAEYFNTL